MRPKAAVALTRNGRGRSVVEWKPPPNKPDNHYLDCIVGAMVAASMLGVTLDVLKRPKRVPRPARRKVTYMD